ncbi:MAG: hypothetical protein ACFFB3_05930 [Candidatus Hodarchaeota archaeon]
MKPCPFIVFFARTYLPTYEIALRADLVIFLLAFIIILETGTLFLLTPHDLRQRILWATPLINLLSSCVLGAVLILPESNRLLPPILFLPAQVLWNGRYKAISESLLPLIFVFIFILATFGLLSVGLEGGLLHFSIQPSERTLWKPVGIANSLSCAFLFTWSCSIGSSLRNQPGNSFSEVVTRFSAKKLSHEEIHLMRNAAWVLFFLAMAIAILWIVLGWQRAKTLPKNPPFDINTVDISAVIIITSLGISFMVNVTAWFLVLPILIAILAFFYLPIIIIILAIFSLWKITWKRPPDSRFPHTKI